MTTSYTRGCALVLLSSLATVAAAGQAKSTLSPYEVADLPTAARYDVTFEDGRTSSLIGAGLPNIHGIVETGDPEDRGPISACFAEGTDPAVMAQVNAYVASGYQSRYQIGARWTGNNGDPITITWSFVPDGLSIPGGAVPGEATSNSVLFSRMDTLFAGQGGRANWMAQFENCFARWSALTGITYTRVRNAANNDWDDGAAWGSGSDTNRGMVRISMHPIDGASNVLAYNSFPQAGDMVIDSSEGWSDPTNTWRFLRNTVMHEHGHGLGFNHCCPGNGTKLMEPLLATGFDGPQHDEVRAGQFNYGDKFEPDNSAAQANDLGAMTPGQSQLIGTMPAPIVANSTLLSIDSTGEVDWFVLQLAEPRLLDITVTPFGNTYLNGPQNSNGSCSAGTNTNSLAAGDLQVQVYKSNGTSLLKTQNDAAAGLPETISGLMAGTNGTNVYVKVSCNGTVGGTQFYRLNVAVRTTNVAAQATEGTMADKVRITWNAIPDATSYQVYRNTTDATFGGTTLGTITPPTTQFDDTTAVPGQQYYYFLKVIQPDDTGYRFTSDSGDIGRRNAAPIANAGPDQISVDADANGQQTVTLDGSGSHDTDGTISVYRWTEGATILAQTSSPTTNVNLPVGVHTITLTVIDNGSASGTDDVIITVAAPGGGCGTSDFNGDGDFGTDADIEAFFACLAGNCCGTCFAGGSDFNGDGDSGTDSDIEAFFRVLSGGPC